ncbi:MAG TPA: hypothetical protein VGC78_00380, partial [Gaiellaceae bacterium]
MATGVALFAVLAITASTGATVSTFTYFADSNSPVAAGGSLTVTIHNCAAADSSCRGADSASPLGSATFTIAGVGLQSGPLTATAPSGKSWVATISGATVTLHATSNTGADDLAPGEAVSVDVTPTITTSSPVTITSQASSTQNNSSYDFTDDSNPDPTLQVNPGTLASFDVAAIAATQTAGQAFSVAATALDQFGNTKTDYPGGASVSGNLQPAPDGTLRSYGGFGPWSQGVATAQVTGYNVEIGDSVTVSDGAASGTSNTFGIQPGPLAAFTWTGEPTSPQTAGVGFSATAKAYDAYGNLKTNYTGAGTATPSGLHNAPNGSHTASYPTWSSGVLSGTFTDYRTEPSGTTLDLTDGSVTASSTPVVVDPGPLASFSWTSQPTSPQTAGGSFG